MSNVFLSNAASFVSCVFHRVKNHHGLLHDSPLLKNTCVRQVVLDKWFPLMAAAERGVADLLQPLRHLDTNHTNHILIILIILIIPVRLIRLIKLIVLIIIIIIIIIYNYQY